MSSLRLYLLGPPRIERDGVPLTFDTRKNPALIAYLAMAGTGLAGAGHTREALVTLLWPELEPSRARAGLRRNLSTLKKALGEEWLAVDRETVWLDPRGKLWLDVDRFRRLLRAWQQHGHAENDICSECLAALAEAAQLYRGDFLEGFSLRDSANFDEWQFFETEGLRQELGSALERLVRGHSALGEDEAAIPYARRWLALDPLHEPAHQQLMHLYAQAGQRAAALRQYEECVRILDTELGLSASEATTSLYEQIRSRPAAREEPAIPGHRPRHNLPAQTTPFVGREEELAEIQARLEAADCRLLTLVGAGGMGKTRLALEAAAGLVARERWDLFEDGVFFVPLAPLQSAEAIVPTVARAVGLAFYSDEDSDAGTAPRQQLLDYLSRKRLLLVMDNCEHLLEGAGLVAEMLRTAPGLKILATSRARLQVQGEYLYHLGGMRMPEALLPAEVPEEVLGYSAIQLFMQSARRVCPGFEPAAGDLGQVARICRLVEGMPLGILLAAGWVEMLSPREIAAQMGQSYDFLETDLRDVPERQRSIRAVFDHSWRLLTQREREVFQSMSVFVGGFTREAAEEVTGVSLREMMTLVQKSLLQRSPSGRYEAHELLRQYAADKLRRSDRLQQDPDVRDAVRDRHSAYYTALLGRLEAELKSARQQEAMAVIDAEIENVRAAWAWATERGQVERLAQAMDSLAVYYRWRTRHHEGQVLFRQTAERLSAALVESPPPRGVQPVSDRATGLRVLSKMLTWQCRFWGDDLAGELLERSLALLKEPELAGHDTRAERAFAVQQMGWLVAKYDCKHARDLCQESLALYRDLDDQYGIAETLYTLGIIIQDLGAYDEARNCHEEALAHRQAMGDRWGIARSLIRMSTLAQSQGNSQESERLARESLAIFEETGDRGGVGRVLGTLAQALLFLGKPDQAYLLLSESPAVYDNLGFTSTWSHILLGIVEAQLGKYGQAGARAQANLPQAQEVGFGPHIWGLWWLLGYVALAEGDHGQARKWLQESDTALGDGPWPEGLCWTPAMLGYAERSLGRKAQAWQHLRDALQAAADIGSTTTPPLALPAIALLLADEGQMERAAEVYALASRYPLVANSQWFEDVAGQEIAAAAASLPPEAVSAAQARGRARDLEETLRELLAEMEEMLKT